MNLPMPKTVCKEEIQNANLDNNEVIIEYITNAQGNKIKKLKTNICHVWTGIENTPYMWTVMITFLLSQKKTSLGRRKRMIDSHSESISSDDDPSEERTITADSNSSAAAVFKETPCGWEADLKGSEATLHQIASSLQSAAEGYLALASHMSQVAPYDLPQVVAKIPPPPMDVSLPIRKPLLIGGKSKAISHLIHGEYELTNTSCSKLQKKYHISRDKIYTTIKGKKRPGGSQYWQKKKIKKPIKSKATVSITPQEPLSK